MHMLIDYCEWQVRKRKNADIDMLTHITRLIDVVLNGQAIGARSQVVRCTDLGNFEIARNGYDQTTRQAP